MFLPIVRFELRYQLRSPVFIIGAVLFFLLTFASVTIDTVQIGARGNININSPVALCTTVGIMCLFALFIVAACVSTVVLRDDETGFSPLIRTTRIARRDYLGGRFVGAMGVAGIVMAMVPLAMLVGSLMPWLDQDKLGPFVLSHYLFAYVVMALPSLLILGAILFALATATRSMMWTYVGLMFLLVGYFGTRVLLRDPSTDTIAVLTDPFGLSWLSRATRYWTASESNTQLPALDSLALWSRGLWLGIGALAFAFAYGRFRFAVPGQSVAASPARDRSSASAAFLPAGSPASLGPSLGASLEASLGASWEEAAVGSFSAPVASAGRSVGFATGMRQLAALTRFDFRQVFRSPAFLVLVALGGLNAFGNFTAVVSMRGVDYLPVTRAMVETLFGSFSIMSVIIAIYYAGELVWRDRDVRFHEIAGATPSPDWAFLVPKVMAISLALLVAYLFSVGVAVLFQLAHGYTHLELGHYLLWFVLPDFIAAVQFAALTLFVQVLVPQKFIGWAVMLLYIVASVGFQGAGFEHHLYDYAGTSPVPLSDMNGLGRFWIGRAWFEVYWSAFALILILATYALWRRGSETRLKVRMRRLRRLAQGVPALLTATAAVVFVGSGAWIYYNTNVLNPYHTVEDDERYAARMERALLAYETVPQPRITDVTLKVDLYPHDTRVVTHGTYIIENKTDAPLDHVHVRWSRPLKMTGLDVDGATVEKDYGDLDYRIFAFAQPMQPGEKRKIHFETVLEERGFPNERPMTEVVGNGTFVDSSAIAPGLGMDRNGLLTSRVKRRKYKLTPADLRPPKLEDASADQFNYLRHDSDWVTADITLSTDADQTPVAPGYTLSDTTAHGRRTVHTHTEAPILNFFSLQSARYLEAHDTWSAPGRDPVALTVYYQPGHDRNVPRMLKVMKESLGLYSERFSPYQFRQLRILEFPAYRNFAQSFANTVPYSEAIGFVEDFDESKAEAGEKIDLVTYVTAHEIGHQWWAHQVIGADKQGMTMLSESFAQYSSLSVMEHLYGASMLRKFLKSELDAYLRSRGGEAVEELPLERVEDQGYIHYRKGAVVMYGLTQIAGRDTVDASLRDLLGQFAFKGPPYPSSLDFIRDLKARHPNDDLRIDDLFERITLYDFKSHDAVVHKRPDGRYDVHFTVEARKFYANGAGKETEAPLAEPFQVGAFLEQPGGKGYSPASVLALAEHPVQSGTNSIDLITDQAPTWVGIDPFNTRIERNADSNLVKVQTSDR